MNDSPPAASLSNRDLWAYVAPFGLFLFGLMAVGLVKSLGEKLHYSSLWATAPEFWIYPLQTLGCGAAVLYWRKRYPFGVGWGAAAFGMAIGLAVFVLWISPQAFFRRAPRVEGGFDPERLRQALPEAQAAWLYALTIFFRFLRLAVVVPLVEEIFWRGFLLRYLIKEDFFRLPFGAYTPLSFWGVALGFMLEHSTADYLAAFVTGALYNWIAVRTRSLGACVLAHALTNLLLGLYVMQTHQWGFW